jgi:hypothetical protein
MFRRIRDHLRGRIERALESLEIQRAAKALGAG